MVATLPAKSSGAHAAQKSLYINTYKQATAHLDLDDQFTKVKGAIDSHLALLQKQAQVKVRNWLKKLSEETSNVVWKKNRNAYARLLLEQLRSGKLAEPFSALPPDGPLPTLPKHMVYAFKPARTSSPTAAQQAQTQQLSASEQLDEYLGRADFRRVRFAEEQAAAAPVGRVPGADDEGEEDGAEGASSDAHYLPGTRIQLRGVDARQLDRLNAASWKPSRLELEAQLGASRERQAELEFRLQQMESMLRQHVLLPQAGASSLGVNSGSSAAWLRATGAAPLGSLLDAIDDGHVSPPKERPGKKELEELIERYEAKKRQWRSPSWAAGARPAASATSSRAVPMAPSDELAILEQLDNFQRQTEAIRQQLAGGAAPATSAADLRPASSLACNTSNGSEWGLPEATPLRQQPTGLRGSGYTPHAGAAAAPGSARSSRLRQEPLALFDGLPPSPAALTARSRPEAAWAEGAGGPGHNRHVHDVGHFLSSSPKKTAQSPEQQAAGGQAGSRSMGAAAAAPAQRPRSPIGPDVRHTKKSAAAAEKASAAAGAAAAALQRLKNSRKGAASPALSRHTSADEQDGRTAEGPGAPNWNGLRQSQACQQQEQQQPVQQEQEQTWVPPHPAAPQFPPDSNAALVAEVRQLRERLMSSLQKHAPELLPASTALGSGIASLAGRPPEPSKFAQQEGHGETSEGGWSLRALPAATPGLGAASSVSKPADSSMRPTGVGVALGASFTPSKLRLTEDASSVGSLGFGMLGEGNGQRLTTGFGRTGHTSSLGKGLASPAPALSGAGPGLFDGGGGGPSLANLSSGLHTDFSLEAFEQQTEALRRQLAGL